MPVVMTNIDNSTVGQQWGKWRQLTASFVLREPGRPSQRFTFCQCDCGRVKKVHLSSLVRGTSTGCHHCGTRTHGATKTPEYKAYRAMLQRCSDPKVKCFPRYGGRGIKVCQRWQESFENFLADVGKRPDGHSLDRINNDGDYEPSNVRWATSITQMNNRGCSHNITHHGRTQTLSEWAHELGMNVGTLSCRLSRMGLERALTPTNYREIPVEYAGKSQSIKAWAREVGIKSTTIHERLKRGWSLERALTTKVRG